MTEALSTETMTEARDLLNRAYSILSIREVAMRTAKGQALLGHIGRFLNQSTVETAAEKGLGFPPKDAEEAKLVEFFRSAEGAALGRGGDYDNLSPAQTAIRAMRKLLRAAPENHGPVAPGGVGVIDLAARSPAEIGRDEHCPPLSRDYEIARLQTKLRRIGYEDLSAQACHQIARQALAGLPSETPQPSSNPLAALVAAAKRWAVFQEEDSQLDQQSDTQLYAEAEATRWELLIAVEELPAEVNHE